MMFEPTPKEPDTPTAITCNVEDEYNASIPRPRVLRQSIEGRSRGAGTELRDDPEARIAFLETFTAGEEKSIMRKVDYRFCVLIGIMYMIKAVSNTCRE